MKANHRAGFLVLAVAFGLSGCLFDSESDKDGGSLEVDGYVRDVVGGPVEGVKMSAYLDGGEGLSHAPSYHTFTDGRGYYRIPFGALVQSIVVIPSKESCKFTPSRISYYDPGRSIHNENFLGYCGSMHEIDGYILTPGGEPVKAVALMIRDDQNLWDTTEFTDQDGYYLISGIVPGHTYTVKPVFAGYRFTPPQRIYEDLARDFKDQDFVATPLPGR